MRTGSHSLLRLAPALALALGLTALTGAVPAFGQAGCEVPLFVKQSRSDANLMVLADNSWSMNEIIEADAYNESITWAGNFASDATYYVSKTRNYTPSSFVATWPKSPSLTLYASDNGVDARYSGNYLNWLFFHATAAELATRPGATKIQVLKAVMNSIINRSERLRIGITVFSKTDDGGNILGQIPKSHNALKSIINGITANANTPSGESLETILDYFGDKTQSPIQSSCQYNFILMMTDGLPTVDVGVSPYLWDADGDGNDPGDCTSIGSGMDNSRDCSDHMDDVAWWMANEDVYPGMDGVQNVYTYVVGYDVSSPLLQETAENGQGLYFEASNAVELYRSVEYALQDILRRISAGSAVAVVSTERGTDNRLYRGKFMPVDWFGYLECFALPHQLDDDPLWEAGSVLKSTSPDSRNLFTGLGNTQAELKPSNATLLRASLGAASDAEAAALIDWARGHDVPGYRDRQGWVLGDIVSSTPVVVGPPSGFVAEESYSNFRKAHENRRRLVYVGANDGMIHAFDAETGREAWAFMPEFALASVPVMADSFYCHVNSCDQTVTVKDVKVNGAWRTVVASGGGSGGASIFALDVTNPASPQLMWQADLPNGMKYHSEVELANIGGRTVALVGSGLDTVDMRAFLYVYDFETGVLLGSVLLSQDTGGDRNRASKPAALDVDLDGYTDLIYVADMLGNVYRLKCGGLTNPAGWDFSTLYTGDQEITADPVAAFGPNGAVYVYFGTGAYIEEPDMESSGQESFVCVFDRHSGATADQGDLVDQTSSIHDVGGTDGWYINLWNDGAERVTQKCVVVAETVIFTSFAPSDDPCVAGGRSWLYQMRYDDGGVPDVDYMVDEEDRSITLGDGIASYPVVDLNDGSVVVQSSDASIDVTPIAGVVEVMQVRSWQETYDVGDYQKNEDPQTGGTF